MIIAKKEKKIILDSIYSECICYQRSKLFFINRVRARWLSQLFYENLSEQGKVKIYRKAIQPKIIKYLISELTESLLFSEVNGQPEKRNLRIREYAKYQYDNMLKAQKIAICEKLGLMYL